MKSNLGNSPHGRTLALLLAFCGAFMVVSASYRGRAGPWGVAAGLVFLAAISLILYRRRALGDPPVQVRLLPEGLAQRDGVGPVTPEPWAGRWELRLLPQPSGRRRLLVHKVAEPEGGDAAYCVVDFEFHCDDNQAWELCRRCDAGSARDNNLACFAGARASRLCPSRKTSEGLPRRTKPLPRSAAKPQLCFAYAAGAANNWRS